MKKLMRLILVIILLTGAILLTDIVSMYFQNKPLLSKTINNNNHQIYEGLYYNIHNCKNEEKIKIRLKWNDNYTCPISSYNLENVTGIIKELYGTHFILKVTSNNELDDLKILLTNNPTIKGSNGLYINQEVQISSSTKKYTQSIIVNEIKVLKENKEDLSNLIYVILDTTETCAEGLEKIYNDGKYEYYLPCIKSKNIEVNYSNGSSYNVRDALAREYITPSDLIDRGIVLIKKAITNPKGNFTIIENTNTCNNIKEKIYQDESYTYYLKCQNSKHIIIKFDNGEKYSLKEALENKYISPLLITAKGYEIIKEAI